jgi:hypothetical protein
MAVRSTGFALLSSSSVQEAQDLAAIAHAATLESRVPFLHFFDGFRTSHELQKIAAIGDAELRALVDDRSVAAHRSRALDAGPPGRARHRAEPGRLLPESRGRQPLLSRDAWHRAARDGSACRRHRPITPPVRVLTGRPTPSASS